MIEKEIHDFRFHEFQTDSDCIVRDLAGLMSLGIHSEPIMNGEEVLKEALPAFEYSWDIAYPIPNFSLIEGRKVLTMEELSPAEYLMITQDQLSRIDNRATIRAKVLDQSRVDVDNLVYNKNEKDIHKYIQLYMPKYLCDTESTDPFEQEYEPPIMPRLLNPKTGILDATVRNYHWVLIRVFDNPDETFINPKANVIDDNTGEFLEFNSAASEWTKLSWFTDFEEVYKSEYEDFKDSVEVVRVPVSSSLTNKTKIKILANFHPERLALSITGNPNVDYSENRYLISMAYIGAVDSFKDSKEDIEGNFGIIATSSSAPAIARASVDITPSFSGLDETVTGGPLLPSESWKAYDQTPGKEKVINSPETTISSFVSWQILPTINVALANNSSGTIPGDTVIQMTYRKREIPRNISLGINGGRTGIDASSIKVTMGNVTKNVSSFMCIFEYGSQGVSSTNNTTVPIPIPVADLASSRLPFVVNLVSDPDALTETIEVAYKTHDLYQFLHRYVIAELAMRNRSNVLTPGAYITQVIKFSGSYGTTTNRVTIPSSYVLIGFNEYGRIDEVVNQTYRDKYGNVIRTQYPPTFGEHTANGTTDMAMYMTDSSDFWQSHYLMFSTTEPFMKKHMYGRSAYTGEYFADRIKITHPVEGARGTLSGLITIDTDSLFAFDELIVNKEYNKDIDKAEETYIHLPITAPYCPFANSPNERNGIGLLREVDYKVYDTPSKLRKGLIDLSTHYVDSLYHFNEIDEIFLTEEINGMEVSWHSDHPVIINPQNETLEVLPEPELEPEPPAPEPPAPEPEPEPEAPRTPPVIRGATNVEIPFGSFFDRREGVTAIDEVDGNITEKITIIGDVDTEEERVYEVVYDVTNTAGLRATVSRNVSVLPEVQRSVMSVNEEVEEKAVKKTKTKVKKGD